MTITCETIPAQTPNNMGRDASFVSFKLHIAPSRVSGCCAHDMLPTFHKQGHVTVSGPVRKRISVWSLSHACQHSRKKRRFRNAVSLEKTCAYATKNVLSIPRQALFSKHGVFVVFARATRFSGASASTTFPGSDLPMSASFHAGQCFLSPLLLSCEQVMS